MKIEKGKYKDKTVEWVFKNDYTYFENKLLKNGNQLQPRLREYCKKYLENFMIAKEIDELEYNRQLEIIDDLRSIYNKKEDKLPPLQMMEF